MNNKVSIIIPTYNCEKYIEKCLDSVCEQTYSNIEILIINDGSTDNTLIICEKYILDKRVNIINIENKGVSNARNIGIKYSTGDYILFVDSDDFLEKDAIEILVNKAIENDYDLVLYNYKIIRNGKEKKNEFYIAKSQELDKEKIEDILINEQILLNTVWNEFIKADIIKNNNIQFNTDYIIAEDLLFNLDIFSNINRALYIDDCLYNYRVNQTSACNNKDINKTIRRIDDTIDMYQRFYSYLKIWNKNTCNNRSIISGKLINAFNYELKKIITLDLTRNQSIEIINKYFNNEIIKKNVINCRKHYNIRLLEKKYIYSLNVEKYYNAIYYMNILKKIIKR